MTTGTLAHTGHGHTPGNSPTHYLVEPAHAPFAIATVLLVAAGVVALVVRRRARRR